MTSNLYSRPIFHPPRLSPDTGRMVITVTDRSRPMFTAGRRKPAAPASAAVRMVRSYLSSPPVLPDV
jgi:hypothetical protein